MEREVSHAEIYRELGVLQGKMDALILSRTKDDDEKKDIFQRLGRLETRMAQVVMAAIIASLVLPPIASFVGGHLQLRLAPPTAATIQK
jgi:hypothetical protein